MGDWLAAIRGTGHEPNMGIRLTAAVPGLFDHKSTNGGGK
jgi:hypothetical protein